MKLIIYLYSKYEKGKKKYIKLKWQKWQLFISLQLQIMIWYFLLK